LPDEEVFAPSEDDQTNQENLRRLIEQVKSSIGIIPFIGAGISIPFGFPGWTGFLLSQAAIAGIQREVRSNLKQNDYEAAAELLLNKLTPFGLQAAIEQNFGDHRLKITKEDVPKPLRYVVQLSKGPVFTTNFDRVLEQVYEALGHPFQGIVQGARPDQTIRALHQNQLKLIKLHGDWEERTDRVLTRSDYERHYGYRDKEIIDFSLPLPRLIKQVLTGRPLLFIGCSLNKDRTIDVLRQSVMDFPESTHFAIVEAPRSKKGKLEKARHLSEHNILPLWYQFGRHESIERILSSVISGAIDHKEASQTPVSSRGHTNPFDHGRPVPANRFEGRREQLGIIRNKFGGDTSQCLSIMGLRRTGRSSLLRYIRERPLEFCESYQRPIIVFLDLLDSRFETPTGLLEGLRRGISEATGNFPWGDQNEPFDVVDGLTRIVSEGYRLIILLDEFESIKERMDLFERWGKDWRAKVNAGLFVLGICSQRPLAELYRSWGLSSPFANIFTQMTLGAFEDVEWRNLVTERFRITSKSASDLDLSLIYELSGGLPYFTQLAASILWEYSDHEITQRIYRREAFPRFAEIWRTLTPREQHALRYATAVQNLSTPSPAIVRSLTTYGLLRRNGSPFSCAFRNFLETQE